MASKNLDECVVDLMRELEILIAKSERLPELNEFRKGYKAALVDVRDGAAIDNAINALRALGWTPPTTYWIRPQKASASDDAS